MKHLKRVKRLQRKIATAENELKGVQNLEYYTVFHIENGRQVAVNNYKATIHELRHRLIDELNLLESELDAYRYALQQECNDYLTEKNNAEV